MKWGHTPCNLPIACFHVVLAVTCFSVYCILYLDSLSRCWWVRNRSRHPLFSLYTPALRHVQSTST